MPEAKTAIAETRSLKSTLNLPRTEFPMKANLPANEPARLAQWKAVDLYGQIRRARAGAPRYILHDGPPYANGAIHLGHALNKCIKDFVVKTKTMAGFDAPYVPGWDCHGLPIEIKVDEQLGRKKLDMDPLAVRRACRDYAVKFVDLQRSQFERLGVFGRWDRPYLTMSREYEAAIAEVFFDFLEQGFVYKGLKPVYWCIHDRTALAEAEVEYAMHTSPSIYVRYKLLSDAAAIDPALAGLPVSTIIWTTTPWTLPASLAVAFNPEIEYVGVLGSDGNVYIVAEALMESVLKNTTLGAPRLDSETWEDYLKSHIVLRLPGTRLDRTVFQHPFLDREILGVNADYVTTEQGTGAVHTAPSHGADDFATGQRYGLPVLTDVDASGRLRNGLPEYDGLTIFKANAPIIELVQSRGALMGSQTIEHSYPHCWRCHNPVIFRATEQWFIRMDTSMPDLPSQDASSRPEAAHLPPERRDPRISPGAPEPALSLPKGLDSETWDSAEPPATTFRQRALDAIATVTWDPAWGQERISNMIATRPDWCISRQRIWGVPIPVFLCESCATPLDDPAVNASIVRLFTAEGADAWYSRSAADLLPPDTACPHCGARDDFRKEMDILDVWFESGASWHAVLEHDPELRRPLNEIPADLYTEGGDQHRGWFHSSLLTSVAVRGHAPYKRVATSGWTLDEQGRAFSKSLGNGVDPVDIANRLGGEIIRLWVASVDFREDVAASESLMQRVSDNYRKLRNTLRFLLGNLHDFTPSTDAVLDFAKLEPLDQYILVRLAELNRKVRRAYDDFEFHRAYHALNEFVNTDLSALYMDAVKDRLYTFPIKSTSHRPYQEKLYWQRRSAQTALWHIAETLTHLIAPILSFTADEVWQLLPRVAGRESSVHLALFPDMLQLIPANVPILKQDWELLLEARSFVLIWLEAQRKDKRIGKSLDEWILIHAGYGSKYLGILQRFESQLPELFNVSKVDVMQVAALDTDQLIIQSIPAKGTKCERCWRYTKDIGHDWRYPTVCLRCAEALHALQHPAYAKEEAQP